MYLDSNDAVYEDTNSEMDQEIQIENEPLQPAEMVTTDVLSALIETQSDDLEVDAVTLMSSPPSSPSPSTTSIESQMAADQNFATCARNQKNATIATAAHWRNQSCFGRSAASSLAVNRSDRRSTIECESAFARLFSSDRWLTAKQRLLARTKEMNNLYQDTELNIHFSSLLRRLNSSNEK